MKEKKQPKQTVYLGVRLDAATAARLAAAALENKRSKAGELRVAVERYLQSITLPA